MSKTIFRRKIQYILLIFLFFPLVVLSHIPNQSYIFLRIYETEGIQGRFEINTREINKIFGTDFQNGTTLNQVKPYLDDIEAYILKNSAFSSNLGDHKIIFNDASMFAFTLGDFIQLHFHLENTKTLPDNLHVTYGAVFEKDNIIGVLVLSMKNVI